MDRDGVINEPPPDGKTYVTSIEDMQIRQQVISEIARKQSLFNFAVATNQQCIGKGIISNSEIEILNSRISTDIVKQGGVPIPFFVCPHLVSDLCACRKPKSGLLLKAMDYFKVADVKECIFIGDSETDRFAAQAVGMLFAIVSDNESTVRTLQRIVLKAGRLWVSD